MVSIRVHLLLYCIYCGKSSMQLVPHGMWSPCGASPVCFSDIRLGSVETTTEGVGPERESNLSVMWSWYHAHTQTHKSMLCSFDEIPAASRRPFS